MVFDDLPKGLLLLIVGLSLVTIELIKILNVIILIFKFLLIFLFVFNDFAFKVLDPVLKRLNLFLKAARFRIEHLSDGGFLFDQLLNFIIFVCEDSFQLCDLSLQALYILLMVDLQITNFSLMHLMELHLEPINFTFTIAFTLKHLQPNTFIFFLQERNSFFEMGFLFHIFSIHILNFSAAGF